VPAYFIWLKYISWLNYSNEILIVNQWDGIENIDCPQTSTICFKNGDDVIKYAGVKKDNINFDFILLGAIIVTLRVLAFLILLLKTRLRK
jgi:hypothetical protein